MKEGIELTFSKAPELLLKFLGDWPHTIYFSTSRPKKRNKIT